MAQLLGPDGEPIRKTSLIREQAAPSTAGVRQIISGHPAQGLTPQRLAVLLRQAEEGDPVSYLELAEEMEEKDLHYLGVLGTRKQQVAQLEITVQPASDSAEDEASADLVRDFLKRKELQDELTDILDATGKGFSATEIMWETSERQWMPTCLEWRDPRWFLFDRQDGRTLHLRGQDGQPEPLRPYKFIVHQAKAKSGLPIRGGLARPVSWWYLFKNYSVKDWVTFAEIYGQPLRVGKYHQGATEDEKRRLLQALISIGTDAAAMIPEGMLLEFVSNSSTTASAELYEKFCHYADALISKAVLGQTLTTEVSEGSRAAAQVHDEVRADIERADARKLTSTLNRHLVEPLVSLNRGPQKRYPEILIGRSEQTDIQQYTDSLSRLVPLGLKVRQSEVRRKIGAEDPEEGDELLEAPNQVAAPVTATAWPSGNQVTAALQQDIETAEDPLEEVVDRMETSAEDAVEALVEQLRRAVDAAEDMEDLQRRVIELANAQTTEDYPGLMGRAMALARLVGRDDDPQPADS